MYIQIQRETNIKNQSKNNHKYITIYLISIMFCTLVLTRELNSES